MSRQFGTDVLLPGDPPGPLFAATKQYVDAAVTGGSVYAETVNGSSTITPNANNNSKFNYTIAAQNVVLGVPSGGSDHQILTIFFTGSGGTRTVQISPSLYGRWGTNTHIVLPDGAEGMAILRRTDLGGSALWVVQEFFVISLMTQPLQHLGCSNIGSGTTSTGPVAYPEGIQTGDLLYAVIHSRVSTTALPAVTNWTSIFAAAVGSGTDGADAGPTRITYLKRVVGTGGVSGTQTFSGLGTTSVQGVIHAFRPRPDLTITEEFGSANVGSGLTIAGTTGVMTLQANDHLLTAVGTPSDTADRINLTNFNISGVFFSDLKRLPDMTGIATGGNQQSLATFVNKVIGGSAAATGIAFEGHHMTPARTKGVVAMKLRAA